MPPPGSLIFILGPRRSGTTLVNSILCADPEANRQIGEAQLMMRLVSAFSWGDAHYDRLVRHYLPSRQSFQDFAAATCRSLLESCWEAQGCPRHLVLKNPELSTRIDQLRQYFPTARYVVCVRDPRDQIASERDVAARRTLAGANEDGASASMLARRYTHILETLLRSGDLAPECFCFVRYEDVVADPKREAARLGAFCGLRLDAFDPGANWKRMAVSRDELAKRPSFSPLYGRPVSDARVGRFRERLGPSEIATIEQATADLMRRFGYSSASAAVAKAATTGSAPVPDIEYVMIAEAGTLERQAVLLTESIRLLPSPAGKAGITVVSPRPSRRPAASTLRRLEALGADYLSLAVDSPCPYYGTSYKLAALREAEQRSGPPTLAMLDSDTLFLAPPTFDLGKRDVALRPVDVPGICTTGPDNPFDQYWRRLCELCAVSYDDIPWLETSAGGTRVKASHNGGLVAANRCHGLFTTSYEFLRRSVAAGLYPKPDADDGAASFRIGAGQASPQGKKVWGAAQATLSLALVALGLEALILPPTYNVPCTYFDRVVARHPEVASRSVHVHYHWLCDADRLHANPLLDGRMTVPATVRKLLARHLPLDQPPTLRRQLMQFVSAVHR